MTYQSIDTAPIDGSPISGMLAQGQTIIMRWWSQQDIANEEGGDPSDYNAGWYNWFDTTDGWTPTHWAKPRDVLPPDHPAFNLFSPTSED